MSKKRRTQKNISISGFIRDETRSKIDSFDNVDLNDFLDELEIKFGIGVNNVRRKNKRKWD